MSSNIHERQHAVNVVDERPQRTPEGDALTELVLQVVQLSTAFTAIGETLAHAAGQTLARWVVLDAAADAPATVAQIARMRGFARQSVQRIADLLVRDGLAVYRENPDHRRAKLLRPTVAGMDALVVISRAQQAWGDAVGTAVGGKDLRAAQTTLARIAGTLAAHPL